MGGEMFGTHICCERILAKGCPGVVNEDVTVSHRDVGGTVVFRSDAAIAELTMFYFNKVRRLRDVQAFAGIPEMQVVQLVRIRGRI